MKVNNLLRHQEACGSGELWRRCGMEARPQPWRWLRWLRLSVRSCALTDNVDHLNHLLVISAPTQIHRANGVCIWWLL